MKKKLGSLLLHPIVLLILSGVMLGYAFGQEPVDGPVPAAVADEAAVDVKPPAPAAPAQLGDKANPTEGHKEVSGTNTDSKPTVEDLIKELGETRAAWAAYKGAQAGGKKAALFALIAALAVILMRVVKGTSMITSRGKYIIPKIALGLGVAVGLFSALAAGQPVLDSVLYGAGPPLAVFLHELTEKRKPAGS